MLRKLKSKLPHVGAPGRATGPLRLAASSVIALASSLAGASEMAVALDPLVVNASRINAFAYPSILPRLSSTDAMEPEGVNRDLARRVEAYAGYGAFRRVDPVAAHPTTQGVRLRNLGINATSRTLLLYDGVPQNDPFGGWIYWQAFLPLQVEDVGIFPSGGETWGDLGAGGVVSLISREPKAGERRSSLSFADDGALDASLVGSQALGGSWNFDWGARRFETDGFFLLPRSDRGEVDRKAYSENESLSGRLRWRSTSDWQGQLSLRHFDEERGNGTAVSVNDTQATDISLIAERKVSEEVRWNLHAYRQERDFRNVFSSVDAERGSELPALDQYAIPVSSQGLAFSYRSGASAASYWQLGFDGRETEGRVHERFRNLGAGFTRDREVGGSQLAFGAYGVYARDLNRKGQLYGSIRYDRIRQREGRRIERDLESSGGILLSQSYAPRQDDELSSHLRWQAQLGEARELYLSVSHGFRSPTLNELYRPFRVRNDITEADPLLRHERLFGQELGIRFGEGRTLSGNVSVFRYEIKEAIANVRVTTRAGFDPRFGFIPAGGSGSLRRNIDLSEVVGFEARAAHQLSERFAWAANLSFSEAQVARDADFPDLASNEFPQSPRFRANLDLNWKVSSMVSTWARARYEDSVYEDLENLQRIEGATTVDAGLDWKLDAKHVLSLGVLNLFDQELVSGLSSDGQRTIDRPRTVQLSWSADWR